MPVSRFCFYEWGGFTTLQRMKAAYAALTLFSFVSISEAQSQPKMHGPVTESLDKLADDFWAWRAKYAPFTRDDVNRIERPGGTRDWSRAKIDNHRKDLNEFEARWKKLDVSGWPVPKQVDYRLIGSALSRVHWELDINPRWKRDPTFYIEQTLTPVVEALTVPAPHGETHSREILTRIENIPSILQQGEANLEKASAPFATVAIRALENIRPRLRDMASALLRSTATTLKDQELNSATNRAADTLEHFRAKLREQLPSLPKETALGREAYVFFLKNVALLPYSSEELLAMGLQEWNRAVAFEAYEVERNRGVPPLKTAENTDSWIKDAAAKELQIREFLHKHGILTVPDWVQHYTLRPMPEYLHALEGFGETDDFTSPSRLKDNCIRYVDPPSGNLGYFWRATAQDPRPITVHEGIPGHYFQLCLSWKHEDPIRRHYYDSGANEGIGFYAEEMMLQAGLYDDSPHTREIKPPNICKRKSRWTHRPRVRRRSLFQPGPVKPSPIRSANSRSQNFWPKRACSRAKNSTSAPSTISSGKTATCQLRCNAGNIYALAMKCRAKTLSKKRTYGHGLSVGAGAGSIPRRLRTSLSFASMTWGGDKS